jgi:putative oxidoreductase
MVLYPDAAAFIARFALGAIFIAHGYPKVMDFRKPMEWVKSTGWPGGATFAFLFSFLEFFGGFLLIIGFLTQIVAALFFLEMIATTIFVKTKLNRPFITGYELDMGLGAFALVLALIGPGSYSVDWALGLR